MHWSDPRNDKYTAFLNSLYQVYEQYNSAIESWGRQLKVEKHCQNQKEVLAVVGNNYWFQIRNLAQYNTSIKIKPW
jgi:hypothetical protein